MRLRTLDILKWGLPLMALALVVHASLPDTVASTSSAVKRSSSAIAITADGATLLVVNPDSDSLTLVDTASHTVMVELVVGQDPRTVTIDDASQRAYVANRGSDSVSVIDLAAQQVVAQASVGRQPYGVVVAPGGDWLCVAEQGVDQVRVLDTATLASLSIYPTADRPSGLAIGDDGTTLYVTHALGNAITVLSIYPHHTYFPLVLANWETGKLVTGEMASPTDQLPVSLSTTIPLWPDSNLVQSIVLSPDGTTAYVPHTRSNTSNHALTFDTTVFPLVSLIDLATQQHLIGQQIDLGVLDPPGVGLPFDAALTPDGGELWVVNAASNDVSVIDLPTRHLVDHVEADDNPRGIVLSPDGTTAYVNNTLAGTVSVIDTATYTVTDVITVTNIPLPPTLLNGKRLFHSSDDPRISKNQWISCNTCHFEGEQDGRTWFFGFAGPRNTTSLLGMVETYPLRWSGEWDESADSEFANRKENFGSGLIDGTMNCTLSPPDCVSLPPNQGRSYDLDCLAAFIDSLQTMPSPGHINGAPLTEAELRGQAIFSDPALGCAFCHPAPLYTDLQMHDVGTTTSDEKIGPAYDTPSLRGLYDSAPYFHDGSAATLRDAITRPTAGNEHDVSGSLTDEQIQDLLAFLLALPFE